MACGKAAGKVPYLREFHEFLNSLNKYFNYTLKNMSKQEALHKVIESAGQYLICGAKFRWGSSGIDVKRFGLVGMLTDDTAASTTCMLKPITTYKFLYCAHFMADTIKHLSTLSKAYQRSDMKLSAVHSLLVSTIETLKELAEKQNGTQLRSFHDLCLSEPQTDDIFKFHAITIKDGHKQRTDAESACPTFAALVVDNLNDRLSGKSDSNIISSLCELFDPTVSFSENANRHTNSVSHLRDYFETAGYNND